MGTLTQYEKLTRLVGKTFVDGMCPTPLQPPPESEWEVEFTDLFGPDWRATLFSPEWREFLLKEGQVEEVGLLPKEDHRQDVPSQAQEHARAEQLLKTARHALQRHRHREGRDHRQDVPSSDSESEEEMSQGDKNFMEMPDDWGTT